MGGATAEDRRRLAELADSYGSPVRAYFTRKLGHAADVDDLTQAVFERLLGRANLDDIANPEGYIFQVAANVLRDHYRFTGRRPPSGAATLDPASGKFNDELSPERVLLGREAYERAMRALLALPKRTRMIVILSRYELLTAREIASRMNLSESLVAKELARAVAHLRDSVK